MINVNFETALDLSLLLLIEMRNDYNRKTIFLNALIQRQLEMGAMSNLNNEFTYALKNLRDNFVERKCQSCNLVKPPRHQKIDVKGFLRRG